MMIKNNLFFTNLTHLLTALHRQQIIAYPTEAVFGLGCDPNSERAVQTLLKIKQRSWKKGLILIAANYAQLKDYIDDSRLDHAARDRMFSYWPGPITWVIPALSTTPKWLTGQYTSLAVRISAFEPVCRLCIAFGKPIVSTSANISGIMAARTTAEVRKQLGTAFPILDEEIEGCNNPSSIYDAISGAVIRQG